MISATLMRQMHLRVLDAEGRARSVSLVDPEQAQRGGKMETVQEVMKELVLAVAEVHLTQKMVKEMMGVGVEVEVEVLPHLEPEEGQ